MSNPKVEQCSLVATSLQRCAVDSGRARGPKVLRKVEALVLGKGERANVKGQAGRADLGVPHRKICSDYGGSLFGRRWAGVGSVAVGTPGPVMGPASARLT